MAHPAISVIVRTYNRPALLHQALRSLAAQSYDDFEVLVVNDGRSGIAGCLEEMAQFIAVREASHVPSSGRAAALNSGLAAAAGRLITYLDDDDLVYPSHLATLAGALENPLYDIAYTRAARALCWSNLDRDMVVDKMPCVSRDFELRPMLVDNWIPLLTFMHRAESVDATGRFDPGLNLFEDWDFLIRLGQAHRFVHVPVTTCEYRYRFGPIPVESRSALRERERVLAATRQIYARYPVQDAESLARRQLTLNALAQDIAEVGWIIESVTDPLQRDLQIAARVGRFKTPQLSASQVAAFQGKE